MPTENVPVGFSLTSMLSMAWSLAEPGAVVTLTSSKYPRFRTLRLVSLILVIQRLI